MDLSGIYLYKMNTNLNQKIFRVFCKEINSMVLRSGGVWSKSATLNVRAYKKTEAGGAQRAAQSTQGFILNFHCIFQVPV